MKLFVVFFQLLSHVMRRFWRVDINHFIFDKLCRDTMFKHFFKSFYFRFKLNFFDLSFFFLSYNMPCNIFYFTHRRSLQVLLLSNHSYLLDQLDIHPLQSLRVLFVLSKHLVKILPNDHVHFYKNLSF